MRRPAKPIDRAFRRVRTGQPLRIQQHGVVTEPSQGLVDMHDAPLDVGGIDRQMNLARVGSILRRRNRRARRHGAGPAVCGAAWTAGKKAKGT